VKANALLLSVAAQFNDPTAVEIMKWLNDTTIISGSNDEKIWNTATIQLDDIKMKQRIVEFSRYADLGIENIEKIDNAIVSTHTQYDEEGHEVKTITFPFRKNESEGTIKYFSLAYPIIDALDNGKRLIIDEFDSKMHPLLTCRIIALFNSKETNPQNAQLIFTTHDTNLLSANIFRRDQVWFTQKDRYGATELYSLAEYKVRNDASFEKDYLSGKYGAIPIVGDLTRLFNTQEN
jgi:AAA15 family ATPase/GTPase